MAEAATGNPDVPRVDCDRHHAGLAVRDVMAAVDFYTKKLGFFLAFTWGDPPTFAGVNLDRVQIFLEQGTPGPEGCSVFFVVGDPDELYEFHRGGGVEVEQTLGDRSWGIRDYTVRDLYGHRLTFGRPLLNAGPPIRIERCDLNVRIEKRLAALLEELAKHKHMSASSCLEEILLHTNDGVTPHTDRTVAYIQELKKKHGIDYDSHGSYRFVE